MEFPELTILSRQMAKEVVGKRISEVDGNRRKDAEETARFVEAIKKWQDCYKETLDEARAFFKKQREKIQGGQSRTQRESP